MTGDLGVPYDRRASHRNSPIPPTPSIALGVLLAAALIAAPGAGAAPRPRIAFDARIAPGTNVLTVSGRVRPVRSAWRIRVQSRRTPPGSSRHRWVRAADSRRLRSTGRFRVAFAAGGPVARIRLQLLSGRHVVRTGRAVTVRAPARPPVPVQDSTPPAGSPGGAGTAGEGPPVARAVLAPGGALEPGEQLLSPGGRYRLAMQAGDGNLVLYDGPQPIWASEPAGAGARAVMQTDGNLVVYLHGVAKWSSQTQGFPGATLALQDDGNLVVYHAGHDIWSWPSGYTGNRLLPGARLTGGAFLRSADRRMQMAMQEDGNLVVYRDDSPVWNSATSGGGSRAVMQTDGNLVVYRGGTPAWASSTADFPGAFLILQNDANAVIYHAGRGIWTWGSQYIGDTLNGGTSLPSGAYMRSSDHRFSLVVQPEDGNVALYGPSGALWSFGTSGHPGAGAIMQTDGNFVVYDGQTPLAHTQTAGQAGAFLRLQNDGNLVVYKGASALWSREGGTLGTGGGGGVGSAAAAAVQWAAAQVGQTYASPSVAAMFSDWAPGPYGEWSGDCAKFAYVAWHMAGVAIARGNAREQYYAYQSRVKGGTPPAGALVFWPNVAAPFGHIAIADGAGGVYTTRGMDHDGLAVAHVPSSTFGASAGWVLP